MFEIVENSGQTTHKTQLSDMYVGRNRRTHIDATETITLKNLIGYT
jgi:hypothetical protein